MKIIDTHCHLEQKEYSNLDEVIHRMKDNIMIASGYNDVSNQEILILCKKYSNIYGVIGIHPEEVGTKYHLDWIEEHICLPKIVGIGEIGLDYHYTKNHIEDQKKLFIAQIEIAKKYHKPIVVHSRDASYDTYYILKEHCDNSMKVTIHAYSGSVEMAREYVKLGFYLGIGGVVTFKNGNKLKEVVKEIPLENILLETDSPYLTPEPFRGKQNEPSYIRYIAEEIAKIKKIPIEKVIYVTTQNAIHQFDLPIVA